MKTLQCNALPWVTSFYKVTMECVYLLLIITVRTLTCYQESYTSTQRQEGPHPPWMSQTNTELNT